MTALCAGGRRHKRITSQHGWDRHQPTPATPCKVLAQVDGAPAANSNNHVGGLG